MDYLKRLQKGIRRKSSLFLRVMTVGCVSISILVLLTLNPVTSQESLESSTGALGFVILAEDLLFINNKDAVIVQDMRAPIWCNGEYEQGARANLGFYGDDFVAAQGHVSIGGKLSASLYCPSFDTYGPDGIGRNLTDGGSGKGVLQGDLHLMDGWFINPGYPQVLGSVPYLRRADSEGYPVYGGEYGFYDSLAATAPGKCPGYGRIDKIAQDNVKVYEAATITDNPLTIQNEGKVISYTDTDGERRGLDPNINRSIASLDPNKGGTVLVTKKLPSFDWYTAYEKALTDGTYFLNWDAFQDFLMRDEHVVFIGESLYYEISQDQDYDGHFEPVIWYVGDGPDDDHDGTVEWAEIHDLKKEPPWELGGAGVIIHGALVCEGDFVDPTDNGFHIYGCGTYDITLISSDRENDRPRFGGFGNDYMSNEIPEFNSGKVDYMLDKKYVSKSTASVVPAGVKELVVPYTLPALVAAGNIHISRTGPIPSKWEESDNLPRLIANSSGVTSYGFIHGTVAAGKKVYINADNLSGSIFISGNIMGESISIEGWTHVDYNNCVNDSFDWWVF